SLRGMQEFHPPYWRPFLKVPKEDLLAYAQKNGLTYRLDSSNDKMIYSRNLIRHKVLPELEKLYPGAKRRIAELSLEANEIAAYCQTKLQEELESYDQGIPA